MKAGAVRSRATLGIGAEIEWRTGFDPDPELADPLMTFKAPSGQRPKSV
jgi:hypothetical protein